MPSSLCQSVDDDVSSSLCFLLLQEGVVQRRADLMAAEGVQFVTEAHVGKGVDVKELAAFNDAVVLAAGATKPRDLPVEGRCAGGLHSLACPVRPAPLPLPFPQHSSRVLTLIPDP